MSVNELPIPVSLIFAVFKELAIVECVYLTLAQRLIQTVTTFKQAGLTFSGTLVDAEFGSKEVVPHFVKHGDALLVRMKRNSKVKWGGHDMNLADLADYIPRSICHHYQQLGWRAKRVPVNFEGQSVDILVIWRNVNGLWQVFFLLSTFDQAVSLGELTRAWKAPRGIEVVHRYIKQKLSFGRCQYRNIRAHQYWVDPTVNAFNRIVSVRKKHPLLSWKTAQLQAAEESFNAVWTAGPLDLNALEAA